MGLYWVPGHDEVRGNEIANQPSWGGSVQKFVRPELSLGVSRQNIRNKLKLWVDNQHLVMWQGPCRNRREAKKFISGPSPLQRPDCSPLVGHNRGRNTLRRYLYVMGLNNNPTYNKCGMEKENSLHIVCESEALASLRHAYLGSFFLDPEDVMDLSIVAIWNFGKGTGLL